jgi:hypothetical protein
LLKAAGYPTPGAGPADTYDPSFCSAKLPSPQPMVDQDTPVAERLFIVCAPHPPPPNVLKDVFCRFGDLIEVIMSIKLFFFLLLSVDALTFPSELESLPVPGE